MYLAANLHIDISKRESSQELNRLSVPDGFREMPERKDYRCPEGVFLFVSGFLNRCIAKSERPRMTTVVILYPILLLKVQVGSRKSCLAKDNLLVLSSEMNIFKKNVVNNFGEHCSTGFSTLKSSLSNHLGKDLGWFGTLFDLMILQQNIVVCT